jgi:hypothetical protein
VGILLGIFESERLPTYQPMKYPKWFPYPSSWLNALLLSLLAGMSGYVVKAVFTTGARLAYLTNNPDLLIPVVSLTLLSPIGAIAIVHHIIHLFLSRYAPSLQAPEIGNVTGIFPRLMSWWEGIWGCAAMAIATTGTLLIGWLSLPMFNINYQALVQSSDVERFGTFLIVIWLTIAAYLYQCFYLVEQRIIKFTVGKSVPQ